MTIQTIETEIREQLTRLPLEQQQEVLKFARSLANARLRGTPGKALLHFAKAVNPADLAVMKQAIDEECERVNLNEW